MNKKQCKELQGYKDKKRIYQQLKLEDDMKTLIYQIDHFAILRETNIEPLEKEITPLIHRLTGMLRQIECVKTDRKIL